MPAAWAAAIGGAVALYSGHQAGKRADRNAALQQGAMDQQAQVAREELEFGKQQYADWQGRFDPVWKEAKALAFEERAPNLAQIQADTGATFDAARGAERRQAARYGLNPSDGAWGGSERQYGISRAATVAGTANRERIAERGQRFNRIAGLSGMLSGQQGAAAGMMSSGNGALQNAYGNQAGMYGNRSNQAAQDEASAFAAAGQIIGSTNWGDAFKNIGWGGV